MNTCIFCSILAQEVPATFVYEDDVCIGMIDINPVNFGHTLVLPKQHFENIYEIPDELSGHLIAVAKQIALAQKRGLDAQGVNLIMNNDAAAGQIVFHAHLHVIPRFDGDGFKHWHSGKTYGAGEAEEIAKKIRASL